MASSIDACRKASFMANSMDRAARPAQLGSADPALGPPPDRLDRRHPDAETRTLGVRAHGCALCRRRGAPPDALLARVAGARW